MDKKTKQQHTTNRVFSLSIPLLICAFLAVFVVGYIGYVQGLRAGFYKAMYFQQKKVAPENRPSMSGCTKELKICPDGSSVGRTGPYCQFEACPAGNISASPVTQECMIGGCSGQICGETSEVQDMMTTCEYKEEYACYKLSTCERQDDGKCGWSYNPEFNKCMFNTRANPAAPARQ